MIINFKDLAKTALREKALLIAEAGYGAIDIEKVVKNRLKVENDVLGIRRGAAAPKRAITRDSAGNLAKINLNDFKRVFLMGIGKGSALASVALAKILGKRLTKGIALDVAKPDLKLKPYNLELLVGTHPLPSKQNIAATKKIIALAKSLNEKDLLITFICGGGSALGCATEEEFRDSILITKTLIKSGASILELNTVRKHLSIFKGGGLAKIAYPSTVISLIVSDVLGNDLSMVASGPTILDKSTKKDAEKIWREYQPYDIASHKVEFRETPKDKKYFKKVKNILFVSNKDAVAAMLNKVYQFGFSSRIYSLALRGEAKDIFLPIVKEIKTNGAIIAAGETTVTLNEKLGKGGRNQEAVLGLISHPSSFVSKDLVVVSFASDGRDNTEAAGAIGDYKTVEAVRKLNLDPARFLIKHDSFHFFQKTGDLVFAKSQSFNVSDLMLVLNGGS